MKEEIIWTTIAFALFAMLCLNASASVSPEDAVALIKSLEGISPAYYISGDTVSQIYNANGLYMSSPDYASTYRYPVYSYNPLDLSTLELVYGVRESGDWTPILNKVLGGTFTETRINNPSGTYQFHWIVANQFANEIDLIRIDPYWADALVVIARYPVSTITTYPLLVGNVTGATSPSPVSPGAVQQSESIAPISPGSGNSIVGKWAVNWDWNCTSYPKNNNQMIINSDGTWAWDTGTGGKWTRTGDNIHIVCDNGPAVYDGTIQANTMSGAISRIGVTDNGPRTGCWSASKVSS